MPQRVQDRNVRFAGYPAPFVYAEPDADSQRKQQLLWGDWLKLMRGSQPGWREVVARGVRGWMREQDFHKERLLEVVLVDVGQGDGCLVVTPDDEHLVIDAGVDDSMYRFLNWRYGGFETPWEFDAAIITHPDQDHYFGFDDLFEIPFVTFRTVYHNGIVERRGSKPLGSKKRAGRRSFLTDLVRTEDDLEKLLATKSNWAHPANSAWNKKYPTMLNKGWSNRSFTRFRMLSVEDGTVPGWGPDKELQLHVLGPVVERPKEGVVGLRYLASNDGKTKNGHSVVLRLEYRNVKMFLGGDLNTASQDLLLHHHTQLDPNPEDMDGQDALITAARSVFQVDVAKACHHGSADISTRFLAALNATATMISSGDEESHAHPRADALGATGKHSRGNRPLVLSTELGRSAPNAIREPQVLRQRIRDLRVLIEDAPEGSRVREKLVKEFDEAVNSIDRSVAVYGAINVRTDGKRVVLAQKLEKPRGFTSEEWDVYRLEPVGGGDLRFVSRY